jgi:hypothetical protein
MYLVNIEGRRIPVCQSRLPDGMFSNQKSQFWVNFEGLGMEKVGIFCGQLEYIKAILNIL